ncbi:protein of unknown function [Bradyrhizobium vignae]|uniref:Serine protease n=1 Tax=Bradyrhizobium vignae TaxID=1549949 RepID=A0A2U3PRP4_9BRAD|nr:protein of unknown function [Bradyrhizobium vignae]
MATLKSARSRVRPSTWSLVRIDQTRLGRSGGFAPTGTAWFLSPSTIVTAEHVATAMNLSHQDWTPIDGEDGGQSVPARIHRLAGSQMERLAVIELQRAASSSRTAIIRKEPLAPEEPVWTVAFSRAPSARWRSVRSVRRRREVGRHGTSGNV